jgi:EmrB/QacA subfamily drug resistance transporter
MSKRRKLVSFVALTIAMFMSMLDSTIINIALPDITKYFNSNLTDTSWISSIYVIGLAVFMIPASKLADQFGRKKVMIIGLVMFGVCSTLCGFSQSLMLLIMMRLFQGIGAALITPLVMPMGIEIFGKEKVQPVAAAVGAVTALAAAGGPPIGGMFIKYINWQSIFFINVPFAVIALLLTILFIRESYDDTVSKSIDWFGIILLTATLFLLTFALLKGNDYGWDSATIICMIGGSALALILFVFTELKVRAPLVELHLFCETTFTASSICNMISGFGTVCPILIFSYFLQNVLGFEALKASLIIMSLALTVIISMPLGTVIASKFGARPVNFFGIFCMGIGAFALSRLTVTTSELTMVVVMIVFGFGLGFASQSIISSIKYLPVEKSGSGSGIVNAARQIGICLGIAVLVSILDSNVIDAKNSIQNNTIASINQDTSIVSSVKTVLIQDVLDSFNSSKDNSTSDTQKTLQNKMVNDVKSALSSVKSAPKPKNNETLGNLYDGASTLSDGASKASDGQTNLNSGITSFDSGLSTLYSGSKTLTSGVKTFNSGFSQVLTSSQQLFAGSQNLTSLNTGLVSLSSGSSSLSFGLNELFKQFGVGTTTQPTLKDNIDSLNSGAQTVASQVKSDSNANLRYIIDSLNSSTSGAPNYVSTSSTLISALRSSSNSAIYSSVITSLAAATNSTQKQSLATTLVLITNTADTNADVTVLNSSGHPVQVTETQATIMLLGSSGYSSATVIQQAQSKYDNGGAAIQSNINILDQQFSPGTSSSGITFYDGITTVADGTGALDQQMVTGAQSGAQTLYDKVSALNSGAAEVASGASQLVSGTSQLSKLQSGLDSLITALSKLENGSSQLVIGSENLQSGLDSAKSNCSQLASGSAQLVDSSKTIKDGAANIVSGVGVAGQANDIQNMINSIKSDKNSKTADAFDKTFLFAAIILCATSVLGLFTDRKSEKE